MAASSVCQRFGFNAVFLVVNVLILLFNFSLVQRPETPPAAILSARDAPPSRTGRGRVGSEVVVSHHRQNNDNNNYDNVTRTGRGPDGHRAHTPGNQWATRDAALPSGAVWENDWDGRQRAAESRGLERGPLRRIWLVRHGDYYKDGINKGHLTKKGKAQVENTGKRLKNMGVPIDFFVSSTSIRAKETADIITKYLPSAKVEWSDLLKEGVPVYPVPGYPWSKPKDFVSDDARLDLAFRKYIHRANVQQKDISNELIVAHGNVIAYFALRGLQVPVERWLKFQVIQGSISMFEITFDGHFNVRILGDMGHIPVSDWTG